MLRGVAIIFDLALLCLFGAGYVAGYVHPEDCWWLQIPATFLFFSSILVGIATLGVAMSKSWMLLAIHLFACVLIFIRFDLLQQPPRSATEEQTLTVLTFNAHHGHPRDAGVLTDTARTNVLEPVVGAVMPDVISLQGVSFDAAMESVGVSPSRHVHQLSDWGYVPAARDVGRYRSTVQPVFARIDVMDRESIPIRRRDGHTRLFGSVTTLSWQGQEFAMYNLHLRSFNKDRPWNENPLRWADPSRWPSRWRAYREDFEDRGREAEKVRELLEKETRPFIICGDFNSTRHNWAYRHIAGGLRDAFAERGRGWGSTYPARFPLFRIDHILVSSHWEVYDTGVLDVTLSDHLPLFAKIALLPSE